ncbi:MAG: transglycosylase domain-containing protein [Hyphomonas sp.]
MATKKTPPKAKKTPATAAAKGKTTKKSVPAPAPSWRKKTIKYGGLSLLVLLVIGGGFGLWKWRSLYSGMPTLPATEDLWAAHREPAIEFLDREGNTLAVRGPRYGRATSVAVLPPYVSQAFIAAEDKRFYEHDGADEAAIARAVWSNARAGETVSGASTLTQQLIKNLVLDSRQTMRRKAQEMKLARQLEKQLSKDEILTLYINRVYFGAGLYGIDAASRFYFGKPPEQLTLSEATVLAALPKAPSKLNLRDNLKGARDRQDYVLAQMVELGFASQAEADAAQAEDITIIDAPTYDSQLGYVLDIAAERVKEMVPDAPGDLVITVSIDVALQEQIRAALTSRIETEGKDLKASQISALVLGKDGRTVAMLGGMDYTQSNYNRVTQSKRQPGSSFKPFVFATALEKGWSPYDVMFDEPVTIGKWQPENYGGGFLGPMTLSEAMARSTNTVAAQLAQEIGVQNVVTLARRIGISSKLEPFPSLALGSQEVTMWEIVRAFGAFQSGGYRMDPYLIEKVEDSRGTLIYTKPSFDRDRVLRESVAYQTNAMMARVVDSSMGTGGRAKIKRWTVAGKTGTSQDWRDAWFVGFTSAYVGGVWVGNDDDSPMNKVSGGGLPSDLWSDMMEIVHSGQPPEPLKGVTGNLAFSQAAESRITFYRGMAMAFNAAAED